MPGTVGEDQEDSVSSVPPCLLRAKYQAAQRHERLDVTLNRSVSWRATALFLVHAPARCHPIRSRTHQRHGVSTAKSNRTAVALRVLPTEPCQRRRWPAVTPRAG